VPDPRGVRHSLISVLLASVAAVLAGAQSLAAVGEWVADAPPGVLAAPGVRFDPLAGRFRPPDEATSGAGMNGASSLHLTVFGMNPVVKHVSEDLKRRYLPGVADGSLHICFGVTEPDAGSDTTRIRTRAERESGRYIVHGHKIWTSKASECSKVLLLVRTTPREQCAKPTDGLTLPLADLDPRHCDIRPIDKMGRNAVASNELFIDGLEVPLHDRIGRGRRRLPLPAGRTEPRADTHRARGPRPGPGRARPRGSIRQGAHRVSAAHRTEPGHRLSAGPSVDAA
jgi:hypothetical protein